MRHSRGRWKTYIQNPSGNWFYQHMETMNSRRWPSENTVAGEQQRREMDVEEDTPSRTTSAETTAHSPRDGPAAAERLQEEPERLPRPPLSDLRNVQLCKNEACCESSPLRMRRMDIRDLMLGNDEEISSLVLSSRVSVPLRETIQILREQLEEAKRAREYEEKEAKQSVKYIQDTFKDELSAERNIKQRLHDELKEAKFTHKQDCVMYRNELRNFQQQAETFQLELEQEIKHREQLQKQCSELQHSLRYSQESLTSMLQGERRMKQLLHEQLKEAKISHKQDSIKYRAELSNIKQQADNYKTHLQREIQHRTNLYKEHEELKHYVKGIQEAIKADLQAESEMKQLLQKQLKEAKLSHHEEGLRWRTELEKYQRQSETFQRELQREVEHREYLQREHDKLQHSLKCTQEALASMIHADKKNKQVHQEQLREVKMCHEEDCFKFKTELKNLQQQAENFKSQLQREMQQKAIFQEVHEEMKQSLICSQESFTFLLQAEREMNQQVQKELNDVRRSCLQDSTKYCDEMDSDQLFDDPEHEPAVVPRYQQEPPQIEHEELREIQRKKHRRKCSFIKKLFKSMRPGSRQRNQPGDVPQSDHDNPEILPAGLHADQDSHPFPDMLYVDKIDRLIGNQLQAEGSQPDLQRALMEMPQESKADSLRRRRSIPGPSCMPREEELGKTAQLEDL